MCKCGKNRIATVSAKCSDLCFFGIQENFKTVFEHDGYVPPKMGIGGGDYIKFAYCLNCGQIQGDFPVNSVQE